jgi:hypothetical protein
MLKSHGLPVPLLDDLLSAFDQDMEKTRDGAGYAHRAELLDYCRRSANPVGRLLLHLYGVQGAQALDAERRHLHRVAAHQLLAGPERGHAARALSTCPTKTAPPTAWIRAQLLALRPDAAQTTELIAENVSGWTLRHHAARRAAGAPRARPHGLGAAPGGARRACAFWTTSSPCATPRCAHDRACAPGTCPTMLWRALWM